MSAHWGGRGLITRAVNGIAAANPAAPLLALINGVTGASFHDFTQATDDGTTWTGPDQSTNNIDFVRATANKPGISATLGATFNGTQLCTRDLPTTGLYTVIMAVVKNPATTNGVLIQDTGGTIYTQYVINQPNALGGAANFVDGSAVSTRHELYTAFNVAGEHIFEVQGLSLASTVDLQLGRTSVGHNGSIRRVAVLPEAALGGDLTAAREAARVAVAA